MFASEVELYFWTFINGQHTDTAVWCDPLALCNGIEILIMNLKWHNIWKSGQKIKGAGLLIITQTQAFSGNECNKYPVLYSWLKPRIAAVTIAVRLEVYNSSFRFHTLSLIIATVVKKNIFIICWFVIPSIWKGLNATKKNPLPLDYVNSGI